VELPAGDGGEGTVSYTVCYAVASNGNNKEAAARLVNFLTGAEGMQAWTDLGLAMPTRTSLREHWLGEFADLEPFLNGADYAVPWQFPAGFQEVMDQINADMQQAFAGTVSVDQVLENAQTVGTEVLNR
jgi:multiple sugar transport system substrate-binding protein